MELRAWVYEDVHSIAELEKECFSDPWNFQMLADSFVSENTVTVCAEQNGEILGYGFAVTAGEDADIANIAVAPQYRRQGIGGEILKMLTKKAAEGGVKRLFLEVRVSNAAAMALYLRHGFIGRYARPRYYGDGEDALVMMKELNREG